MGDVQPEQKSRRLRVRIVQASPVGLDVEFDVQAGEVVALLGASGSGKTTTLRAIAGLTTPDRGHVSLDGEIWFDDALKIVLPPEARRVGFVFQDYALFPHLTALGNVMLAMNHVAKTERAAAAMAVLARVGIEQLADRRPRALSGGERQRVAMARALARDPKVLLLDEPFSAVDRPTRELLKAEIKALASAVDIPVILVTHDIDEAVALSQRLVILDAGRTIAKGTPDQLFATLPNDHVRDIIGTKWRRET